MVQLGLKTVESERTDIFLANCRFRVSEVSGEIAVNLVDQKRSRITLKEVLTK